MAGSTKQMKRENVIVYSVYMNANLKRCEGRKLSREDSVPDPHIGCMFEAAQQLGFQVTLNLEKCHPKSFWERGRLSVAFFNEDKSPINPEIPNRMALYKAIAAKVKELGNTVKGSNAQKGGKKKK